MKTLITIFASLFIGFAAIAGDGTTAYTKITEVIEGNVEYSIYAVSNTEKIKFSFEKTNATDVKVNIYNESYDLIYSDKIENENEGRIAYNLKELGGGTYHVKVVTKGFSKTHTFTVGEYAYENSFNSYISALRKDGKVHITFQDAFAPVSVKLYDTEGVVYHDELISNETSYNGLLNLTQLDAGEYTVSISSGGKTQTETISIK